MARRAYALQTLLSQVNTLYPNRSKASDGWLGDAAHATRLSDHNPLPNGVVCAQDFTHDPDDLDCNWLAEQLVKNGDPRIKYIIWNKRIWQNGTWKSYSGLNDHTKHLHLSVGGDYDNASKWSLGGSTLDDKDILGIYEVAGRNYTTITQADYNYYRGKKPEQLTNDLKKSDEWKQFSYKGSHYDADVKPGIPLAKGRYEVV